jgi:glycosyltransferase involved in cell wall biosynthesis
MIDSVGEHRSNMKVVAAIPCHNEERCVGSVVVKAKKFVDCVVVIDDGSTDATAEIASGAGAAVHAHGENRGYGAAIRSAMAEARRLGADILVVLDGDGQHDPNEIPSLIRPLVEGESDIALGSRFIGDGQKPPLYRRVGQRVLTATTNIGSGQRVSDSQSGFRAYSARALRELRLVESGMSISSEIQFAVSRSGLKVAEVPINVSYADKSKRSAVGHGFSVLSRIFVLISLKQPLVLFGVPGLGLLAGGLVLGARVLSIYGETNQLALGTALGTVLLCLAGLLSLFAALMLQSMKELMRGGAAELVKEVQRNAPRKDRGEEGEGLR